MRDVGRVLERSLTDETVFGRGGHLKVFVSSQMRDDVLAAERRVAIRAIDSQAYYRAWAWERDAAAGPYSSEKVCVGHAASSDALVLLLADDLTNVTAKEYRAAKKASVPCFVLLKDGATRTEVAEKFVIRERKSAVTANFANLAEVRTQIREALRNHVLWLARRSIANARAGR